MYLNKNNFIRWQGNFNTGDQPPPECTLVVSDIVVTEAPGEPGYYIADFVINGVAVSFYTEYSLDGGSNWFLSVSDVLSNTKIKYSFGGSGNAANMVRITPFCSGAIGGTAGIGSYEAGCTLAITGTNTEYVGTTDMGGGNYRHNFAASFTNIGAYDHYSLAFVGSQGSYTDIVIPTSGAATNNTINFYATSTTPEPEGFTYSITPYCSETLAGTPGNSSYIVIANETKFTTATTDAETSNSITKTINLAGPALGSCEVEFTSASGDYSLTINGGGARTPGDTVTVTFNSGGFGSFATNYSLNPGIPGTFAAQFNILSTSSGTVVPPSNYALVKMVS